MGRGGENQYGCINATLLGQLFQELLYQRIVATGAGWVDEEGGATQMTMCLSVILSGRPRLAIVAVGAGCDGCHGGVVVRDRVDCSREIPRLRLMFVFCVRGYESLSVCLPSNPLSFLYSLCPLVRNNMKYIMVEPMALMMIEACTCL